MNMMIKARCPKQAGVLLPGILCAMLIWYAGVGEAKAACNAGNILYNDLEIVLSKDVVCIGGTVTATVTTDPIGANVTLTSISSKISITPTVGLPGVFTITGGTKSDAPKDVPLVATIISGVETDPEVVSCIETSSITVLKVESVDSDTGGIPELASDETAVDVTITGFFAPTVSFVDFGPGITVNSFTRDSDTETTANITVLSTASAGERDVSVTSGGITCTGSDLFLVVQATIHYCWNPCSLGAEQEILFADGARNTPLTAHVTKSGGNPVPGKQVAFSIDSGDGTVAPATDTTDAAGDASSTLTAGTAIGRTKVKAVVASTGTARVKVYMYKQEVAAGPPAVYYDFNEIISDADFTTAPTSLDSRDKIELWLRDPHHPASSPTLISGLAWRGYGPITAADVDVLADPITSLPSSGTVRIDNEEIAYTSKQTTYPPKLTGCTRGANGTSAAAHNSGNANSIVLLKTTLNGAVNATDTTIAVDSTTAATKSRGTGLFIIENEQITYTSWDPTAKTFNGCTRGANGTTAAAHADNTAAFYEVARAGTLISSIIQEECSAHNVSPCVVLVHLQKEQQLISIESPTDGRLNHGMGLSGAPTNIKDQIERGIGNSLRYWYDNAPAVPHIFPKGTPGGTGIGYADTVDGNVGLRLKINNAASYSLYKFTPWIRATTAGMGNYLFYDLWDQYGF
jgi:hypothetical protein